MKMYIEVILIMLLLDVGEGNAQYWGEQVLEKSFEQTDFFFVPSSVNPFGIGSFKMAAPGIIRDPLVDLMVNPARLNLDSTQRAFVYTDFRSARDIQQPMNQVLPLWSATTRVSPEALAYYPMIFLNTRRELEPVFTGAIFGRPLPAAAPGLIVGATYQLLLQDEKYYSIPQDIYHNVVGYDYSGRASAAVSSIPIVDRYSGRDNMHQAGDFVTGFVRYVLPEGAEMGVRLGRVTFTRAGGYGSSNLWQYTPSSQGSSLWSSMESRDQSYSHWDAGAGIDVPFDAMTRIGVSGGYLWGDATQALRNDQASKYDYAYGTNSSYYMSQGTTREEWRHHGGTVYYGLDVSSGAASSTVVTMYYQHRKTSVDIGLTSNILDTSYSTYTWMNGGTLINTLSNSFLSDVRAGSGTQTITDDRIMAGVEWTMSQSAKLSIGLLWTWQTTSMNTDENALVAGRSLYVSSDSSANQQFGQGESKDLLWSFSARRSSFQIPILLTVRASTFAEFIIGLNRVFSSWKIDDVTLALFRYRMTMMNGLVSTDQNFGERYTEPEDVVSDVRTTFLLGTSISPSANLKIRLLMVPNFQDTFNGPELSQLQWWIGVNVTP